MTKNPILNASTATAYIIAVASVMYYGPKLMGPEPKDTVLLPVAFLSLFVLSTAVMGYLFLYQPVLTYLEGQKQQALELFLKTVGIFALITLAVLSFVFLVA